MAIIFTVVNSKFVTVDILHLYLYILKQFFEIQNKIFMNTIKRLKK